MDLPPRRRALRLSPLATLPPSSSRLWQTAPHPTLPLLATACADKTVRISSLATFGHVSTVTGGHKRSIRSVAWKPGSGPARVVRRYGREVRGVGESVLVTGSFDASAGVWRRFEGGGHVSGQEQKEEEGEEGDRKDNKDAAQEVDFTRDGQGKDNDDDDDDDEWAFAVVLDGHESEIKSVSYSPVGPFLATCSRDRSVWIWEELDDDNFETVAVLQEHEGDVKCVAWHPDEIMVASGSYDDSVRLWRDEGEGEDWGCAAVLEGFGGTVWGVEFEPKEVVGRIIGGAEEGAGDADAAAAAAAAAVVGPLRAAFLEERKKASSRLVTCSDDKTIRIWRRIPKETTTAPTGRGKMPSILRTHSIAEEWVEDARLPQVHERAVYAVNWSRATGQIVSCGSDGRVVVYEERWRADGTENGNTNMSGTAEDGHAVDQAATSLTQWVVVADVENAHDVFEVNHVTWALRADEGKRFEDEEVIVSTGDDGEVKIWSLSPEE